MSKGFGGAATRGIGGLDREVESRLGAATKRLDVFTDEFSPPGISETTPGQDVSKGNAPYGKPHDDSPARADRSFTLAASGNARDQEPLDEIDAIEQQRNGGIKPPSEQFPGDPNEFSARLEKRLAALGPAHASGRVNGLTYSVHKQTAGFVGIIGTANHQTGAYRTVNECEAACRHLCLKIRPSNADKQMSAKEPASDNAAFDVHVTDPARLKGAE